MNNYPPHCIYILLQKDACQQQIARKRERYRKEKSHPRVAEITAALQWLRSCRHCRALLALAQVFLHGNYLQFINATVALAPLADNG